MRMSSFSDWCCAPYSAWETFAFHEFAAPSRTRTLRKRRWATRRERPTCACGRRQWRRVQRRRWRSRARVVLRNGAECTGGKASCQAP